MKINDNRKRTMQPFKSILRIGEIFEYANKIYMKIIRVADDDSYYNAVCLNDGELAYFNNERVRVLNDVALEIY